MRRVTIEKFLLCPACRADSLRVLPFDERHGRLVNGVVICDRCAEWYRLEDGLLELLVRRLRDPDRSRQFRARFGSQWSFPPEAAPAAAEPGDWHKIAQREFYDEDAASYEAHMLRLPFWRAFDQVYLEHLTSLARPDSCLLEVGGGTGRFTLPVARRVAKILSFDVSEGMVRIALSKRDRAGLTSEDIEYFVADAENIPIRAESAGVAVLSGILHHVAAPDRVLAETARVLQPGGAVLGTENNRTAFRPLFDLLMRARRLWNEKAHEEHFTIAATELAGWLSDAAIDASIWTSVFVPPHLFGVLSARGAVRMLRATDSAARGIPWLREQGGVLIFTGTKRGASSESVVGARAATSTFA